MVKLSDGVVAWVVIFELDCYSMDFDTLVLVSLAVVELHISLALPIPSKDDDLVRIQKYAQMIRLVT